MTQSLRVRCSELRPTRFRVVGDKSLSHRAFLLNALGEGQARIRGANPGADVASTRSALRALGVSIVEERGEFVLRGRVGRMRPAVDAIDCGNSGTTMRLLAGILAAQPFTTTLDGDASLRTRPMTRVAAPLRALGARVEGPSNGERAPLIVTGGKLSDFVHESPIASAQVKSALLLAAACAGVALRLREPSASRDHSERMLRAMGAQLEVDEPWINLSPGAMLRCVDVEVPGDPSAAALAVLPFLLAGEGMLCVENLLRNPTRDGFFRALQEMGVPLRWSGVSEVGGEERGTLELDLGAQLGGLRVLARDIPAMIDEVPALVAASLRMRPGQELRVEGVGELRVKESDRVAALEDLLGQAGVKMVVQGDCLIVPGGQIAGARELHPADDHRMAMLALGLATAISMRTEQAVTVHGTRSIGVSDPDFVGRLRAAGVEIDG